MAATSEINGREIVYQDNCWIYKDTGKEVIQFAAVIIALNNFADSILSDTKTIISIIQSYIGSIKI